MNDILRKFISVGLSRKLSCIGGNNQLYDCSALRRFRAVKSYKQKNVKYKTIASCSRQTYYYADNNTTFRIRIPLLHFQTNTKRPLLKSYSYECSALKNYTSVHIRHISTQVTKCDQIQGRCWPGVWTYQALARTTQKIHAVPKSFLGGGG